MRQGVTAGDHRGLALSVVILALAATATPLRAGSVYVEAKGRLLCGGVPLARLPVELWDSDVRGSVLGDDFIDAGITEDNGTFYLSGSGGDPGSRPDVYVRAIFGAAIPGFAADGTPFESRVDVENEAGETRFDKSAVLDESIGTVDFGDLELQDFSGDCNVFIAARDVVNDWHSLMRERFAAPGGEARILRWSAVDGTAPHAAYDIVKLPRDVSRTSTVRSTLFHELGHVIWFSTHSRHDHWVLDLSAFVYARAHRLDYHARDAGAACNSSFCAEGFAWSEGFADFWQLRAGLSDPTLDRYTPFVVPPDPSQEWEYEGNVRNRLRFLAGCASTSPAEGYRQVYSTGRRPIPLYTIHSLPDFEAYFLADHPEAASCISRNSVDFCNRLCNTSADCGGSCPRCFAAWQGDVRVSTCKPESACGLSCRTDADCGLGGCRRCIAIWQGDVQVNTCVRGCDDPCRTDADCANTACSKCTPVWQGDVQVSMCRMP
jgi:Transthyretin-like family